MTIARQSPSLSALKESPDAQQPVFCRLRDWWVPLTGMHWNDMQSRVIECVEHKPPITGGNCPRVSDKTGSPQRIGVWMTLARNRKFADSPLEGRVVSELVSLSEFPVSRELTGNLRRFGGLQGAWEIAKITKR